MKCPFCIGCYMCRGNKAKMMGLKSPFKYIRCRCCGATGPIGLSRESTTLVWENLVALAEANRGGSVINNPAKPKDQKIRETEYSKCENCNRPLRAMHVTTQQRGFCTRICEKDYQSKRP